ncbi:MAG: hypothetical protein PHT41_05150 [Candidatus Omnitrophica bacterium]|nr:hypothetical protein [Candidatus Omnitrophota bacterium]
MNGKTIPLVLFLGLFILGLGVQFCLAGAGTAPADSSVANDTGGVTDPPPPPPQPDPNPDTPPSQIDAVVDSRKVELTARGANKTGVDEEQELTTEREKRLAAYISLKKGKNLVTPPDLSEYKDKE